MYEEQDRAEYVTQGNFLDAGYDPVKLPNCKAEAMKKFGNSRMFPDTKRPEINSKSNALRI